MVTLDQIKAKVEEAIPDCEAEARDLGGGDHVELIVVASAFEGKTLLERHRMVYGALGSAVGNEIHALALKTLTPKEANK